MSELTAKLQVFGSRRADSMRALWRKVIQPRLNQAEEGWFKLKHGVFSRLVDRIRLMSSKPGFQRAFPIAVWMQGYKRDDFIGDAIAGAITAVLLVPQGMAYAMLAGLPPETGLYASIVPPIVYALLGSSRTMSVGPVSVAAIMVASVLGSPEMQGHGTYLSNALVLAMECGLILLAFGALRLGVLVNFISHPVLSGFTSGAAIIILLSQLKHLTGLDLAGELEPYQVLTQGLLGFPAWNIKTVLLGAICVGGLLFVTKALAGVLKSRGASEQTATAISKIGPLIVVLAATILVVLFGLNTDSGVSIVGEITGGLPTISLGFLGTGTWILLFPSALLIALIAYVESVSVAKVLGHRRRQRIDPNQELVALGAANVAAAFTGTMPVAGGFSRSMVNFAAGARTQMAAIITALLVALAAVFLMPLFTNMPKAALAAIIVVAVFPLIDIKTLREAWHYDRADASALLAALVGVLVMGVEGGLILGVVIALTTYLWRTGRPHIAVVGRIEGSEHYRNIKRHDVRVWPDLLLVRVDENLYFANTNYVEDFIAAEVSERDSLKHIVLICSAISFIDTSAMESLEKLIEGFREAGISVNLAEVKGPVMDRLHMVEFERRLQPGQVFLTTDEAVKALRSL